MMNQGMNTQTLSVAEPNSLESQYVVDASQEQTSYLPSATGSEPASWNIHGVDNRSTENGIAFTASYSHDQQTQPASINVQDGLNTTALASSTVGTSVVPPDYSSYASYANAADPYSYANTGYPSYYSGYQQQPSHSYVQQQPSHSYPQQQQQQQQQQASHSYPQQQQPSHSYPQEQPNHSYPQQQQPSHSYPQEQPNHSYPQQQQPSHSYPQEQPNHSYPQQQPNHSYTQQQPNHSYSQPVGAYENTGAPYQPISSFQNTGSYAGTASYATTYYNPGDYQTAGGYASSGYSNQPTSWTGGNYANYTSHQYSSYGPDTTSAYSSTAAPTSVNYEQQYKQWTDYYSQTEVSCAPGTEHLSVASASNQGSSVTGSYPASNSQPPSSFTPSWRPESTPSELPSQQPGVTTSGTHDVYWKQGGHNFQNNHASPSQPQFQSSLDSKTLHDNFQELQKGAPQGPLSQYPAAHQVAQSYQPPFHTTPSVGTQRVSKLQIPTNPRIASNVHGLPKIERDSFAPSAPPKPAYVSVSMPKPKPNDIMLSHDAADYELKPGAFPKSLRSYVERVFELCKTDEQRMACQVAMKEVITKATADGTLHTRDWNAEPLFPLLNTDIADEESSQISTPISSLPKYKRSPSRRPKSRWEPLPQEKLVDKPVSVSNGAIKYGSWDRKSSSGNYEGKEDAWSNIKFSLSEHKTLGKGAQRSVKRQRLADDFHAADNGDASSDSDKEQSLTPYYSSAMALATPEEKRKRESRSKRFDRGQGNRAEISYFKPKNVGAGNLYSRRASAVMLSKSFDDGGSRAVEDIDWDALTIKGTCQEIEKRYLRLTSAPDPSTVRPEEVLEKALLMVQNSQKNYLYKCDQLKSIRQDLTVQRIRNQLTVKVYETHARLAVEVGDLPEYNQCQSQLKTLYAEGIEGCHLEFAAYNLLCVILHSSNNRDLVSSMSRLTEEAKKDRAVKHALAVRAAVTSGNYVMFFRLYKEAPNLNTCLMDLCVEKVRYKAVSCMSRSYRPTVSVPYIAQVLGFSCSSEANDAKDSDGSGLEECVEWLKAHGACLIADNNGEMQFDAKASSSSLFMPEPEDAVAHGDTTLAVNDFLTRTS